MKPLATLLAAVALAAPGRAADVDFNRDVRPVLADACFPCHGFDAKARKAKLRLDIAEGAFAGRDAGVPVKPGDPAVSLVWERIASADPDLVMPPPATNKTLTAAQKETIKAWIGQGAKYQKHWSFEPVRRPQVPAGGGRNPIDAFLLARLKQEGLTPRPEADRGTLIRRAAFALNGLPPTVAEVDQFLADRSPDAYEKMVDRYLASPRYGEEMARHWLDVARYADTHGLHLDNERQLWPYRDWVVRAFNENTPFDRFTVEQLAGDLLPNPTPDQLTATGFNRCNVTTGEGGSIEAEWVYRNAVDRAATAAQGWLGLTAGCAVCHDHKFDPISAREFYSLYAFFLSSADPPLDGNVSVYGPAAKLPTAAQRLALDAAAKAEAAARSALEVAAGTADYREPAADPVRVTDILLDDAFPLAATDRNTTRNPADWVADPPFGAKSGRRVLRQANSYFHEDMVQFRLRQPVVPAGGRVEAWVWLDPKDPPAAVAVAVNGKKAWWGRKPEAESPYAGGGMGARQGSLPRPGGWVLLSVAAADLGLKDGQPIKSLTLQEYGGIAYWDAVAVSGESDPAADPLASFRAWWKGLGVYPPPELPAELHPLINGKLHGPPTREAVAGVRAFWLAHVARPVGGELAARRADWERARADREALDAAVPATMIFRDAEKARDAFVMARGQYDKPGEKVRPGVPAALPPLKPGKTDRATRLDLADWLVSPDHPLTPRVAANRLWQQFFGVGLVKTAFDFGAQGEPPSHPELLDWLADEYRASGWDTKRLVKLLVMSDAFRRDAAQSRAERAKDPENRLLARGPRLRLDAEQIRDNALAVGGLVDLTAGGRGVRPYQPPNIWEPVGYADSNTRYYLQDHGAALYRRSLYVFVKRTAPHPFLTNFDAPNREQLCASRDRTNTPLQALQLMNDVQHVEAARALAERTIAAGKGDEARVTFLYRTVLARRPDTDEVRIVAALVAKQRALYDADPAAAKSLVSVGESKPKRLAPDAETAAWTMAANLVLNLDEAVTRN
ncbi:MAG: PSD1 and planctomycete cytochrome C domain-containing protein [Gemmataceae bacterium]|nr:PSD1 and planctomycete cytochrome C domain-containing protein [Gemmataceae bacterium]